MKSYFTLLIISILFAKDLLGASSASWPECRETGKDVYLNQLLGRGHHTNQHQFYPSSLTILPEDGRGVYFEAFAAAKREIRIEICVLEDPLILESIMQALERGVCVKAIVDNGKYETNPAEQANLATYFSAAGGQLHLSNPIFPRSFPKVILIDHDYVLIGSACLDSTTFAQYRDYVYVSDSRCVIKTLAHLFENDWQCSAEPGKTFPIFNPTPPIASKNLLISPVNSASRLVSFIQKAKSTLDITSELLGNPTLESELTEAVSRGVRVRLIAPEIVNGATPEIQELQESSLSKLKSSGVHVHVTGPVESLEFPYMHARTAIADGEIAYLGSISLSPDSITFNREVGIILNNKNTANKLKKQFKIDFYSKSRVF
jgi:cardiolipin synthase A/B